MLAENFRKGAENRGECGSAGSSGSGSGARWRSDLLRDGGTFWGSTASTQGGSACESSFGPIAGMVSSRTRYARTGRGIFFTTCSPRSSNVQSSLSRTWSRTTRLIQIPPGSASASSRAATFTPSPKMSYSSTITSPRLIPIRKVMRPFSGVFALRSAIPRWTSAAHRTASTTLGNSARKPSPVFFTIRPGVPRS